MPPIETPPHAAYRPWRTTIFVAVVILLVGGLAVHPVSGATPTSGDDAPSTDGLPSNPVLDLEPSLAPGPSVYEMLTEYASWRGADGATEDGSRPVSTAQEPWDSIDACVISEMTDKEVAGVSLAVWFEGELAHSRGYGVKHTDMDEAVNPDTLFRIGSSTKMMTAAAIMQQVERGAIDLTAPVTDVITDLQVAGAWEAPGVSASDITGWNLLTHSSAFPDNLFLYTQGIAGPTEPGALADWAADLDDVVLHAPPGSFWNYSNPNYSLAGRMVEAASGQPYAEFMEASIWAPAGMSATFLDPADAMAYGNYSYGHDLVDAQGNAQPPVPPDAYDNAIGAPAGFAFSTTKDMVRWAKLLMDGGDGILEVTSVDEMHEPHVPMGIVPDQSYGYGIFVEQIGDLTVYHHAGNIPGWSSQLIWVPQRDFAVSVLANEITPMTRAPSCALIQTLQLQPPSPPDYSTDPETWERYTGRYRGLALDGSEMAALIDRRDDVLHATILDALGPGQHYTSTMPQLALDSFRIDTDGDRAPESVVTFLEDPDQPGEVRWLRHRGFVLTRQGDLPPRTPTATGPAPSSPTPVPPDTPTAIPASPTPSPFPTVAIQPEVCDHARGSAPDAARQSALANPQTVQGYGMRCFPTQPESPFNPLRDNIGLLNPNRPYHPTFNPLVFKCGCP